MGAAMARKTKSEAQLIAEAAAASDPLISDPRIGRDGQPWELEPLPHDMISAKGPRIVEGVELPAEPGHDDKINGQTRRRKHRSRFEQYAYRRLTVGQINAFEWFQQLCEIVAAGTLSQSRYGNEAGAIDCATYGERQLIKNVRVMEAARARRKCVRLINEKSNEALKAVLWAATSDLTPKEIGERFLSGYAKPENPQIAEREAIGLGFFHLFVALEIVESVYGGRA